MTQKSSELGCSGDIHLLHHRNPTAYIANNLSMHLIPLIKDMGYLQLNGDIFDKSGVMSELDVHLANDVLMKIMQECDKHGTVLRILEGTASHDRGQLAIANIWYKRLGLTNDMRYVNRIEIETIESLNMTVLHIPDNLPFTSSDSVMDHIAELLSQQSLTEVDYAFCHGYFDYAVGYGAHAPRICFRPEQFHFVKYHVLCSHVHSAGSDNTGKIMYTKSFDRLAHGEEDPKGFLIVDDFMTSPKVRFLENSTSMSFVTITPKATVENCIDVFDTELNKKVNVNIACFVRLVHPDIVVRKAIREWMLRYPLITFSDMSPNDMPATTVKEEDEVVTPLTALPTEEQLPHVLFDTFQGEYSLSDIRRCMGMKDG